MKSFYTTPLSPKFDVTQMWQAKDADTVTLTEVSEVPRWVYEKELAKRQAIVRSLADSSTSEILSEKEAELNSMVIS